MKKFIGVLMIMGLFNQTAIAAETVALPSPETTGGQPLMEAMSQRRSNRDFVKKDIDLQTLSNILWAAYGINRKDGHRTIPTARGELDLEVYVVKKDGAWHYDAKNNALHQITPDDLLPLLSTQDFMSNVPVVLVYTGTNDKNYSAMHAGSAYQNVGLYCASAGMKNVVRGWIDNDKVGKALKLGKGQQVIISQAIGW